MAGRQALASRASWCCHIQARGRTKQHPTESVVTCQASANEIKLICTDVDGTLLNSKQQLLEPVQDAITAANEMGVPTMVATGKARGPWSEEMLPKLPPLPGVFMQGLLVHNVDGSILYEKWLEPEVVAQCVALAEQRSLTLAAYCGERILAAHTDEHTDRLLFYREPTPEGVGDLREALLGEGAPRTHKCLFMGAPEMVQECRPEVEELLGGRAAITTALSGMLEVLPYGASKAAGVQVVLERLGIAPENVLAMGDAENDIEMLKLAGVSAAMGNASEEVKRTASFTVPSNDEGGVAVAIRKVLNL